MKKIENQKKQDIRKSRKSEKDIKKKQIKGLTKKMKINL